MPEGCLRPNELALSLLIKLGATFPAMQQDGQFDFLMRDTPVGFNKGFLGEFGLAFDAANLAQIGDHFGIGLRTDLTADFMAGGDDPWDLPDALDYFDVNNYMADLSLDLKLMLDMTFDPAVIYLGVGAGLGMPISDKGSFYANIIEGESDWFSLGYYLSGVLGVRFYMGDLFSLGIEGGYRYVPSKDSFTDGTHLFSGDIVLGFTF